ncbi:hypothetical protein [Listeria fleischmannii]|nr:hypothetical protein [Listeria fleischmannii]
MTADGTGKAIFSVPAAQVGNVFEATQTGEMEKQVQKTRLLFRIQQYL